MSDEPSPSGRQDLAKLARDEGLLGLLRGLVPAVDAVATGAIGSEQRLLMMVPGRLVQAARNGQFVEQLGIEFERLRKEGAIAPDYKDSEQFKACLQELLAALENPPVDQQKFDALREVFLNACREKITDRDDPSPQILINVARQLSGGALVVLGALWRLHSSAKPDDAVRRESSAEAWLALVSGATGFHSKSLVEVYESELIGLHLISGRKYPDRSGIDSNRAFRLNDLGQKLCEFMSRPKSVAN